MAWIDTHAHLDAPELAHDVDAVRQRLHKLGLDQQAIVVGASVLGAEHEARVQHLWDEEELTLGYQALRTPLAQWLTGADALALDIAARECFVMPNAWHQRRAKRVRCTPLLDRSWLRSLSMGAPVGVPAIAALRSVRCEALHHSFAPCACQYEGIPRLPCRPGAAQYGRMLPFRHAKRGGQADPGRRRQGRSLTSRAASALISFFRSASNSAFERSFCHGWDASVRSS